MLLSDEIYGDFRVEKVVEELINSFPVQRLKGIHQGGAGYLVNPDWNVTRYEHSIGVMLLIRILGGSIKEQIAGLLHDVSHTAFSHVVDFVFGNQHENYHEQIYHSVVGDSEIPEILGKFSYNCEELLFDDSKWTLLEQPAPELCADRVDYTLRDMYRYGHISKQEVQAFLNDLQAVNGEMYLRSINAAEWFVQTYYKEVIDFFMDPLNIFSNDRLAKTLKLALDKQMIDIHDFLNEDDALINKIKTMEDEELNEILDLIHPYVNVQEDEVNYDLHRKSKVRLIDPSIINGQGIQRASVLSERVKKMNNAAYEKSIKGTYVRIC
ncbi:HD domain-containing protein [Halobacillus salinarum]|uniref:HD domain-containing protein n=1 Tax=Halobacillus salinarum TaxID=2932257 RepID=A0ABY4EPN5_9BACI|nr:HD domain-containing protein [Halobacillus salinarum]UOQ46418.1 HD domain-containing protein [Halobacillus salinarum]